MTEKSKHSNNHVFLKLIENAKKMAAKASLRYINGAYIFASYIEYLESLGYNMDDALEPISLSVSTIYESLSYLESMGFFGVKANNITADTVEIPNSIQEATNQIISEEDDSISFLSNFLTVLEEYDLIDEELEHLVDNLKIEIDLIAYAISSVVLSNSDETTNSKSSGHVSTVKDLNNKNYAEYDDLPESVIDVLDKIKKEDTHLMSIGNYNNKIIATLCRKKKKNACLVGESGVGKTSIAKYFIKNLSNEDTPEKLKDMKVYTIDATRLISNTSYRGEFEEKALDIVDYLEEKAENHKVLLFLDNISEFMSLGATDKDETSLMTILMPYIADGRISLLSTAEQSQWHKFVESNKTFLNIVQVINVKEPSIEESIDIVNFAKKEYEDYHNIKIPKEIVRYCIKLSDKYLKQEKLPNKAIKILDQAAALANLSNSTKLKNNDILNVVADMSEIDIKNLSQSDEQKLKNLDKTLHESIIAQNDAVNTVVRAVKRGKLELSNPDKPIASMIFVGPTGVGKTELTKQLHKAIFNHKESMLRLDMSEFTEEASVAKLIGAAPGYVGFENGGKLTEYVKHNPSSLILFDEIEKANPKVYDSLLQVLDNGILTDNTGSTVDFKNCIIIFTSNAGYGAEGLSKGSLGFTLGSNTQSAYSKKLETEKKVRTALEQTFRPEFLNRLDAIVLFEKLSSENAENICRLMLNKLKGRLEDKGYKVEFTNELVKLVTERGYSDKYGARNVQREIQNSIEDNISDLILNHKLSLRNVNIIDAKLNDDKTSENEVVLTVKVKK